jgi:hypothetical protein
MCVCFWCVLSVCTYIGFPYLGYMVIRVELVLAPRYAIQNSGTSAGAYMLLFLVCGCVGYCLCVFPWPVLKYNVLLV